MNVVLDALAFSNIIVLSSIGLTLTYITLKVPNFAHGDLVTIGAYTALAAAQLLGITPYAAIPLAFIASGMVALASYYLVYRPLDRRGAGIVTLMIASMSTEIILRASLHIFADVMTISTKSYWRGFLFREEGGQLTNYIVVSTVTAILIIISLYLFLHRTKYGVALRAAVENPSLASAIGIDVDKARAVSWLIAGGLAGVAGVFMPFRTPTDPETGWALLLRMFAASVLGGLDAVFGAVIGGYVIGLSEVLGIYLLSGPPLNLSTAYRPAIPFAILVILLLIAPRGLSGVEWRRLLGRMSKGVIRSG